MRLTFLGTAAGMPTKERNVTALTLAIDDSRPWYLIDCGEGTQRQLLHCRYTLSQLQAIFITHLHGDHIFGLPGLLSSAGMQGRTQPLTLCGPHGIEAFVNQALACADVKQTPFALRYLPSDEATFTYQDDRVAVTSHPLSHGVPSFAYRFAERSTAPLAVDKLQALGIPQGPLWGQLQQGHNVVLADGRTITAEQVHGPVPKGRVVVIGGDNDQPECLHTALLTADLLVHEATLTEAARQLVGPAWRHSTAKQVAQAAAQANVPHLILTHFSNRYRSSHSAGERWVDVLRQEAEQYYSGHVVLAQDLAVWQLQRTGELSQLAAPASEPI